MASASSSTDSVISSTTRRGSMPVRVRIAATVVTAAGSSSWRAARFTRDPARRARSAPARRPARAPTSPSARWPRSPRRAGTNDAGLQQPALRVLPAHQGLVALHRQRAPGRRWAGGTRPSRRPRPRAFTSATSSRRSTADVRIRCSKSSTRALPLALAAYIARSASCSTALAGLVLTAGQAEARADPEVAPGDRERHVERGQHPLGEQRTLGGRRVALHEDGELVATDPRHGVADAHAGPQSLAHRRRAAGLPRRGPGCR